MSGQEGLSPLGQFDPDGSPADVDPGDEPGVDGVLPDCQPGTGCPPSVHNVDVVARFGGEPGEEVDCQRGKDIGHGGRPWRNDTDKNRLTYGGRAT